MTIKDELIIQTATKIQGSVGTGVVGMYVFGIPLSDWASMVAIVTMVSALIIQIMEYRRNKK